MLAFVFEHGGNVGSSTLLVRYLSSQISAIPFNPAFYMWLGTPVAHGVSPQLPSLPRYQTCPSRGLDQEIYAPRALWQAPSLTRGDGRLLRRGHFLVSGEGTRGR